MNFFHRVRETLALPLIISLVISTFPVTSFSAENISTDTLIEESVRAADRELVYNFLSRDDVRKEMGSMGIDPEEAYNRLNSLSDSEIQQIAGQIKNLPAGAGAIESIVGAAVLIFIILLITDLLCLTNFFNFTTCVR